MLICSTPYAIRSMTTKNRFIRSATMENMADHEGVVREAIYRLYYDLALGGTGLIITGATAVEKMGCVWKGQAAIWDDRHIEGLSKVAAIIHRFGAGAKCAVQLHHGGAAGYGYSYGSKGTGYSLKDAAESEIFKTTEAFGQAAARVQSAGFDAIAVHGAHGYLPSQFLSPLTNNRSDRWGGSLENRLRFSLEVVRSIRQHIGSEMPILWKINCDDYLDGGMGVEAYADAAAELSEAGVDLIEISGGMKDQIQLRARLKRQAGDGEAYFGHAVAEFRKRLGDKPLAVTGGIRSLSVMEGLLKNGLTHVGMSRPLISEPDLPNRLLKTRDRRTARCISCNKCLVRIASDSLKCVEFDAMEAILRQIGEPVQADPEP